jgi:prepilin-type N-terminal cleavage/methylation domain-containing protein
MRSAPGFTLIELVVVTALIGIVTGIAFPLFSTVTDRMKLNQAAREVERAIHYARTKAVQNNRPMRVRFNCPLTGQYRVVEVVGSPSAPAAPDGALDRCDQTAYPYPPRDTDPTTRPNLDGPVLTLDPKVRFGAVQTIEFWPDGSAHELTGTPGPLLPTTGTSFTVTRTVASVIRTATITVNGIGKIKLNPVP